MIESGSKFNKLIVTGVAGKNKHELFYECICECGEKTTARAWALVSGHKKSCGCNKTKHGDWHKRIYKVWEGMVARCENIFDTGYKNYGARGISVCFAWHEYIAFRDWATKNGYTDKLEIDRRDNNKGYAPDNCRFVDRLTNAGNKRTCCLVTVGNTTQCLSAWSRQLFGNSDRLHEVIRNMRAKGDIAAISSIIAQQMGVL